MQLTETQKAVLAECVLAGYFTIRPGSPFDTAEGDGRDGAGRRTRKSGMITLACGHCAGDIPDPLVYSHNSAPVLGCCGCCGCCGGMIPYPHPFRRGAAPQSVSELLDEARINLPAWAELTR